MSTFSRESNPSRVQKSADTESKSTFIPLDLARFPELPSTPFGPDYPIYQDSGIEYGSPYSSDSQEGLYQSGEMRDAG